MRPDRLVPTLVLLGVLAALLVGSLFTHLPGVPSVATALLGLGWPGWDRAADMATVVGLPLGIIALTIAAWEQIRISRELRRRPKPVVGFFPDMSERALDAIRIGRYPEPRPTKLALGIGVENRGERTARNVTLKVRGPSRSAQPGRRSEWSVTASKDWRPVAAMHPGQKFVFNMQISEYPAEVEVELLASLSFDDSPVITTPLVYGGGDPGRGAPGGRTRVRVMDHSGSSWITVD